MNIVFWNNSSSGTGAATSNLICMATSLAYERKLQTVLTQTQFNYSDLESGIIPQEYLELRESASYFENTGVDSLIRKIKFNHNAESYKSCFVNINKYIEFLPPTAKTSMKVYENELLEDISGVVSACNEVADLTFIDIPSGKSKLNIKLLEAADAIVVNLSQNTKVLNEILMNNSKLYNKSVFVIGNYSQYSKNNLANICKRCNLKKDELGVIPFNVEYMDSLSDGTAIDFVIKNMKCHKKEDNYEFIYHVKRTANILYSKLVKNDRKKK